MILSRVYLLQSKTLIDAIHNVDGHICKGKPREAHTFYMVPVDPATQHFRGDLKMTINTVYPQLTGTQSLPAITTLEKDPVFMVVDIPKVFSMGQTAQSQVLQFTRIKVCSYVTKFSPSPIFSLIMFCPDGESSVYWTK